MITEIVFYINLFLIIVLGPKIFEVHRLRISTITFISIGCTLGSALAVWLYVVPFQKEKVLKEMILRSLNERIQEKKTARELAGKPPIVITRKTFDPHNYFFRKSSVGAESQQPAQSLTRRTTVFNLWRGSDATPLSRLLVDNEETAGTASQENMATTAFPTQKSEETKPSTKTTKQNLATTSSQKLKSKRKVKNEETKPSIKATSTVPQQNLAATAAPSQKDEAKDLKLQQKIACKNADIISMLFTYLQILSACFASFAHGSNNVTNAIGPLVSLYEIYVDGDVFQEDEVPLFILLYGGIGITIGLWIWGRLVISTIGEDLTKITPVIGFTVSFCSALNLVIFTNLSQPVSSTHSIVGAIIAVGLINSRIARKEDNATACMHPDDYKIDWKLCRKMAYAWFLTVPVTAALSAGVMYCFILFVLPEI